MDLNNSFFTNNNSFNRHGRSVVPMYKNSIRHRSSEAGESIDYNNSLQ